MSSRIIQVIETVIKVEDKQIVQLWTLDGKLITEQEVKQQ